MVKAASGESELARDRLCRQLQAEGLRPCRAWRVAVRLSSRGAGASHERPDRVAEEVVGNRVGVGEKFDREVDQYYRGTSGGSRVSAGG